MRVPTLTILALLAGLTPAYAQLSGGVGSSNAANQQFQLQNQIRGLQQQQTFDTNQTRMQIDRNQIYNRPVREPGIILRR